MNINYVKQPENSSLCGQCCVAMIANVSLEESIKTFGKRSCTTTKNVIEALKKLGIKCGDKLLSAKKHEKPQTCICVLHYPGESRTHWTVWHKDRFYDSAYGIGSSYIGGAYVTSYLPIYIE